MQGVARYARSVIVIPLALLRPYITQAVDKIALVAILYFSTWVPKMLINVVTYNMHSRMTTISQVHSYAP